MFGAPPAEFETLTTMPVTSKCGLSVVMVTTLVVRDQLTPASVAFVNVTLSLGADSKRF